MPSLSFTYTQRLLQEQSDGDELRRENEQLKLRLQTQAAENDSLLKELTGKHNSEMADLRMISQRKLEDVDGKHLAEVQRWRISYGKLKRVSGLW